MWYEGEPDHEAFVPPGRDKRAMPMHACNSNRVATAISRDYMGGREASGMAGADKTGRPMKAKRSTAGQRGPDWASGLKQLYDSVIEEPIPDTFKDLLSKLDDGTR